MRGQCLLSRVAKQDLPDGIASGIVMPVNPEAPSNEVRAQALIRLAASYLRLPAQVETMRNIYRKAYLLDPTNPHVLAPFIEYQIESTGKCDFVQYMPHTIRAAIERCRIDIRAEIDLPWAYLAMARLHLISDEAFESLRAYTKAIDLCISGSASVPVDCFDSEIASLHRMCPTLSLTEKFQWAERLLLLGRAVYGKPGDTLEKLGRWHRKFKTPVVIVAGSASKLADTQRKFYKAIFRKVFKSPKGTVISGGPTSGIPELLGTVLGGRRRRNRKHLSLVGYVPATLLLGLAKARKQPYDLVGTAGVEFSPWEPLQYWTDLLAGEVEPQDVFVLGIAGGPISALEFRLALALGATVGVMETSGGAASSILRDPDWQDHSGLLPLPDDPAAVWAFVNQSVKSESLRPGQIDTAAKSVHRQFREMKRKTITDPSFKDWKDLREDFKESNRQQVGYMEEILKSQGFTVYKTEAREFSQAVFHPNEIDRMAEMEHGRWIVERLRAGWRYGSRKDEQKRISPYLVAWKDLPNNIRDYDRDAVENFREVLKRAGLRIARTRSK
jgi:hypothetical protein